MIKKCDSTDSIGWMFTGALERVPSHQQPSNMGSFNLNPDHPDGSASAFKRVVSQEQELRLNDVDTEHLWFRQLTKEFNEIDDFERMVKDKESYIGKIFSKTFSDFQPRLSNQHVITSKSCQFTSGRGSPKNLGSKLQFS